MVHIKVHRKPKRRQISGLGNEIPLTHSTRWWLASLQNVLTCPLIRLNSMKYIRRVFHIEIYPWRCHAPARNGRRRRWGDQWRWRAVEDPQVACNWGMESHHITENPKKLMNKQNKPGGGGGTEHSFMPGGLFTKSIRSPFYIPFLTGEYSFRFVCLLLTNGTPFTFLVQNAALLFTYAVYAPYFKYE